MLLSNRNDEQSRSGSFVDQVAGAAVEEGIYI